MISLANKSIFMTKEINKQIKLLEKYGVNDYVIENGRIVINGNLWLYSLTTVDKGFLNGTIINGNLWLDSLTTAPENFLEGTTINGWFWFDSLKTAPENFLFKTTIKGWLSLDSLTTVPENFLEGATIWGGLSLKSLTTVSENFLSNTIVEGWVTRKNARKYGFLSRNKNTDKIVQFVKDNVLEGEDVEIRQDKTPTSPHKQTHKIKFNP